MCSQIRLLDKKKVLTNKLNSTNIIECKCILEYLTNFDKQKEEFWTQASVENLQ